MKVVIKAAWPDTKLMNANDRDYHFTRAARTRVWREAAGWWARQHRVKPFTEKVRVHVMFGVKYPGHRRDPLNFAPTIKAIVDGLTDVGLWPDDNSTWVENTEPAFTDVIPNKTLAIIIETIGTQ